MAIGVPTLSWKFGRPRPRGMKGGRGLKTIYGSILTDSGNSAWMTCGIEKVFRRCDGINFNITEPALSGYLLQWKRSATHKAGVVGCFVQSGATSAAGGQALHRSAFATTTCALFTAVGI